MLERYGDVEARAYTAFMFYEVLLKHLKIPHKLKDQDIEAKMRKPHTAATRYINLYAASDANDADDKDHEKVNMILDRTLMWDASKVPGCQSCYSFKTGNFNYIAANGTIISRNFSYRRYPCPFITCACARTHIDGPVAPEFPPCQCETILEPDPPKFKQLSIRKKSVLVANDGVGDIRAEEEAIVPQNEAELLFSEELKNYLKNMFCEANFKAPVYL